MTPIYEVLPGWQRDITASTRYDQLPAAAKDYVKFLGVDHGGHHLGGGRRSGPRAVRATFVSRCVVVGSGAREHALAWPWRRARRSSSRPATPASRRTASAVSPRRRPNSTPTCSSIGPEQPLVEGLADQLRAQGKTVVGPGAVGAQLEGSRRS